MEQKLIVGINNDNKIFFIGGICKARDFKDSIALFKENFSGDE